MTQLTIKDNSEKSQEEFHSNIPKITEKLANKTLTQLKNDGIFIFPEFVKDSEDLSGDQMVLQRCNDVYKTGNVMGFLGYKNERLVISSRFSDGDNDFFLQYMLERVLEYPHVFDLETDADFDNKTVNLLMFLFPVYLQRAMRKGLFKTYIRVEYNNSNPKGTIDVARHIKKNLPFVGNIAYNQREYSYDNYLIQLIRHTIEFIKQKKNGNRILAKAKDECRQIVEVTESYNLQNRQRILAENQKKVMRHAYFTEYRALQHLCILILQNQKQSIGIGKSRIYGILFDGAWLWEEYVYTLVKEKFHHPKNKAKAGHHYLFSPNTGKIYPDFMGKDKSDRIIADAKYKPFDNIKNADYFQVLAYMLRFDSKKGMYFYPESGAENDRDLWLRKGTKYDNDDQPDNQIHLIKHGLKIPQTAENYKDFSAQMKAAEAVFKQII